jgi:dipeptidyl-peptidase-4
LYAIDGRAVRQVHAAREPLADHQLAQQSFFTTETADGKTIYGHVLYPPKLEEGKKYPVINYVYGGPHAQLVQDTWLGSRGRWMPWMHYMATQGYVIFRADGRGTPNRGIEWEQEIFRRMGTLEIEDQVAALDHVIGMGFADPDRVGVTGWSYGGYMTLSLMTRKGDRYHVGAAGSPVTDWQWYETGYGERYMDTPETNPEGYAEAAVAKHLDGLKGRLLIVHGSSDDVVVPQHTLRFASRCIESGKPLDYMVYPGQEHGFAGPYFLHCLEKMTRYFDEHLQREEAVPEPAKVAVPIDVKVGR